MGILATNPHSKTQKIIVSQDKDMKTIPTQVWDGKDLVTITEGEANYRHLYQTLIGDAADGYKGCPGVGPVKATKLLDADPTWATVVAAYTKAGLTEADALTQARLARILRWSDWDAEKKEPILWTP
jgi:DNA polymerase-1